MDDDELIPRNVQKWRIPKPGLEESILKAARPMVKAPRYTSHEEKKAVQDIARAAFSARDGMVSIYPLEWVEHCIEWCKKLWKDGRSMSLENLIKYINNKEKMNDWLARWAHDNHVILNIQEQH